MVKYWIAVIAAALLCFVGSGAAVFLLLPAKELSELVGPFEEPLFVEGRFPEVKAQLDKAFPGGLGPFGPIDGERFPGRRDIFFGSVWLDPDDYTTSVHFHLLPEEDWKYLAYPYEQQDEGFVDLGEGWVLVIQVTKQYRDQVANSLGSLMADGYSIEWEEEL